MFTRSKKARSIFGSKTIDTKIDIAPGLRLWPVALALSILIWIIATTGGRQVFVKEVLGDAFDSQAEHFLHGNVDVDSKAIRWEAMLVNGKTRMYFGPFPALLRIPLNLIYPAGRGAWSRISGFLAGELALFAFTGLISNALRTALLSSRARNWLGGSCLVGFVFGTPFLFLLGNLSIYSEAILWALAWSLAALFFVWLSQTAEGRALTASLLGFSVSAACALLSRVTYGAPLLIIAGLWALALIREKRFRPLVALLLPLSVGIAGHLLLSYARFGTFSGINFDYYINPVHREISHKYGMLNLQRFPYGVADYFGPRLPAIQSQPPFFKAERHFGNYPPFYSLPFSETYLSVTWASSWLVLGALLGIICLFSRIRTGLFKRAAAVALATQCIFILCYYTLAQRYSVELYPFLIFCFVVLLSDGGKMLARARYALIGLVLISATINSLATDSWLAADRNLPVETQHFWNALAGKKAALIK
jgi:hypothetical protein